MNNDKRIKRLQRKQAKKKYIDYKKNKNAGNKKTGIIIIAVMILIFVVGALYYFSEDKQVIEEVVTEEEGQLTIEKAGEVTNSVSDDIDTEAEEEENIMSDEEIEEKVDTYLSSMNTESRVGQLFMITPEELTGISIVVQAGTTTQSKLKEYAVGGLLFSDQNVEVIDQLKLMLNSIEAYTSTPIFLAMDEEGATRVTNTNSTLSSVGLDMYFDGEELYLLQGEEQILVSDELNVNIYEDGKSEILDAVIAGSELLVVTDDFETLYSTLLDAARSGELDSDVLEARARAILTYKVKYGL